jgi:NADH-quinone oxidoreductase subunit H
MGWQLLLPLAVLNIIITATCVALLPAYIGWWVNGIVGLAVVVIMLLIVRQRSVKAGTRFTAEHAQGVAAVPVSVHLAKFEPVVPAVNNENHKEEQEAVQV